MKIAIHQPNFFPRLKVLQKIAFADIWVVLDNVQFVNREWQNRCRIVSSHGVNNSFWCTVPVNLLNGQQTLIADVTIANPLLELNKIRRALKINLSQAQDWNRIEESVSLALNTDDCSMSHLAVESTLSLLKLAGKIPQVIYASDMDVNTAERSGRLSKICQELGGTIYLADSGALNYLNDDRKIWGPITIQWQKYNDPISSYLGIPSFRNISAINLAARNFIDYKNSFNTNVFLADKELTR